MILSRLHLLLCFACMIAAAPLAARTVDNRPVYYVMLKVLEDGYETYNENLQASLGEHHAQLQQWYEDRRRTMAEASRALESEREQREAAFKEKRDSLNGRIRKINEQIALRHGRDLEARRIRAQHAAAYEDDPRISALMEKVAVELAEIEAVKERYLEQARAQDRARMALTDQVEEYLATGHPLAREIRALEEDLQRYAESERRKLKEEADTYATDYAAYTRWQDGERAEVNELRASLARAVELDREQRALHAEHQAKIAALIAEYNQLVEIHNRSAGDDPKRRERAARLADLQERMKAEEAALSRARQAVLETTRSVEEHDSRLASRYDLYVREKKRMEAELAREKATLNAARLAAETAIEARRRKVDAQVMALEADISLELRDARRKLESLSARMNSEFGREHVGLDAAIARVLEEDASDLLYAADGAPRYDLSRPQTAMLYTAVERAASHRREIDAVIAAKEAQRAPGSNGSSAESGESRALERELAAIAAERQQLLEAQAGFAREHQSRARELKARERATDEQLARKRRQLGELYAARARLTRAEFEDAQRALVAAIEGLGSPPPRESRRAPLLAELEARRAEWPDEGKAAMGEPKALLAQIAADLPPAHGGGPATPLWQSPASASVIASRELAGDEKLALVSAWLGRFRQRDEFRELAEQLSSGGGHDDGVRYLEALFVAGLLEHGTISEQRLSDGAVAIRVTVLERSYQLGADGALESLPPG